MACDPPATMSVTVSAPGFEGNWYGIRPDGVTTFHSDSSFFPNGDIVVRFFTCLSTRVESQWTDRGNWSYADDVLTITLTTASDNNEDGERYTHQYILLNDDHDKRTFRSKSGNYTFWLQRRWRDEPYDCATTRADLDIDRKAALADGRFHAVYPDYTGPDL
jgi:hypothetical protein